MRCFFILLSFFVVFIEVDPRKIGIDNGRGEFRWERYGNADQALHRRINSGPIENFILRSPQFNSSTKYDIVLLVISAQWERAERREIREQWAARKESSMQKTGRSLVIFLVGRSTSLNEEAATYGDLLQVDIEETCRNLVYKIEVGFRWLQKNVKSDFVAKIDSDTVVHIDRLHGILKRHDIDQRDWLACTANYWSRPVRQSYNAWFVSESDYSSYYYPHYCFGPGYAMKRATFDKIVSGMGKHMVIEVEDVFFTGIVATDFPRIYIDRGIATTQYTSYSRCDSNGPILSMLNTEYQFGTKYRKDLTAAWERLKAPICYLYYNQY